VSEETMRISASLSADWWQHVWNLSRPEWRINGQAYKLAEPEQYEELGEDPDADDLPVILFRPADGRFFEVDFEAIVHETSAESRKAQAERLRRMGSGVRRADLEPSGQSALPGVTSQ